MYLFFLLLEAIPLCLKSNQYPTLARGWHRYSRRPPAVSRAHADYSLPKKALSTVFGTNSMGPSLTMLFSSCWVCTERAA